IIKSRILEMTDEAAIIDQQKNEYQDDRDKHPVEPLNPYEHLDQRQVRNQRHYGSDDDQACEEIEEDTRAPEVEIDALGQTKGFANGVSGGQRKYSSSQERSSQQPD